MYSSRYCTWLLITRTLGWQHRAPRYRELVAGRQSLRGCRRALVGETAVQAAVEEEVEVARLFETLSLFHEEARTAA